MLLNLHLYFVRDYAWKNTPVFAISVEYTHTLCRDIVAHFKIAQCSNTDLYSILFRSRNSVFFGLKTSNKCNNRKFSGSYLATFFSIALGT